MTAPSQSFSSNGSCAAAAEAGGPGGGAGALRRIALFGGSSEIGLAIVEHYLRLGPAAVVLVGRPSPARQLAAARLGAYAPVEWVDFDAADLATHAAVVDQVWALGVPDVVIIAFGQLGDATSLWCDHAATTGLFQVNLTAAAGIGALVAKRWLETQGKSPDLDDAPVTAVGRAETAASRGLKAAVIEGQRRSSRRLPSASLIVLSSVAGQRVRRSNFVYGATKAGLDAFFVGLGETLRGTGLSVLVARPGKVATKLIAGLAPTPGTISADRAARTIVAAARRGRAVVWTPWWFGPLMGLARLLPSAWWWRLPY